MSYKITLTNKSRAVVTASDGTAIAPGGSWTSGTLGDASAQSPLLGSLTFVDLGDRHISGDSGETWGVLISLRGGCVVGRYEGGGSLVAVINDFQQVSLRGMDFRSVTLPPLTIS